jgi:hypothetical protein
MCMSTSVISVPRNDREFVQQAIRPISEVLGVQDCSYIALLDRDHQGIAEMCKKALIPQLIKKTNQDYGYSMLFPAVLLAGAAAVLTFLKSGSDKTVLIGTALGAIVGSSYGWSRAYFAKEVDKKETEVSLHAETERNWLRSKQPQIKTKLKEVEDKVQAFTLEDFDRNDENKDIVRVRDQLLLLKSYVEKAVGTYHSRD